jgi:hypothetical protein
METFKVLKTTWQELEDAGYASVTDYCRFLVKQKRKLPDRIEIYRDEVMCMTVTNVKEAAKFEPKSDGWRKYASTRGSKGRGRVKSDGE